VIVPIYLNRRGLLSAPPQQIPQSGRSRFPFRFSQLLAAQNKTYSRTKWTKQVPEHTSPFATWCHASSATKEPAICKGDENAEFDRPIEFQSKSKSRHDCRKLVIAPPIYSLLPQARIHRSRISLTTKTEGGAAGGHVRRERRGRGWQASL
jgi:hypothetical protein